jgi:uncharacterized protein involved in exopolysaccharide biosynthesis
VSNRLRTGNETDTIDLAEVGLTLRRNASAVLLFVALGVLAAIAVILLAPRRFEGRSTIMARAGGSGSASIGGRIEGIGELLGGIGSLAGGSGMETELQILRSRELAGKVVDSLQLQLRVREPRLAPFALVEQSDLPGSFGPRTIRFERLGDASYRATSNDSTWQVTPGTPSRLDVGTLTLRRVALPARFELLVYDREAAIDRFLRRLEATKAGGEVARVVYQGDDSVTAAAAANLLTALYLETHKTIDRGVNQRRVEFVLTQLDSTARALAAAERDLREYQESSGVIDHEVVGEAEIESAELQRQRLTELQVEEGTMKQLLAQADGGHLTSKDLAAYPGFLKGTTAASLANQLTTLEAERIALLQRRTEKDPDVVAIDKTMRAVEANIVAMARSYTGSVSRQRGETEARLDSLQRTILAIPAAAERGGRLKRDVIRLTQIYTALQAQLVEARFGAVSEGGMLRQIDVAVPPRAPSFPKPMLTLGIGTAGGLLCGLVAALFLGWFGRWLRDPQEVERAVGVLAQRYQSDTPLLMSGTPGARTVLLVPLGSRAPLTAVAERLERTARQRALHPVVVDLTAWQSEDGNGASTGGISEVIERLEQEHSAVIVQLPALGTEATVAALSETRPVLLVAPPGPIDRGHLNNAVNTLRLLKVPCAGIIMNDGVRRVLT